MGTGAPHAGLKARPPARAWVLGLLLHISTHHAASAMQTRTQEQHGGAGGEEYALAQMPPNLGNPAQRQPGRAAGRQGREPGCARAQMLCVSEYLPNGNLEVAIRKDRDRKDKPRLLGWHLHGRAVTLDIARGLAFLHTHKARPRPRAPGPPGRVCSAQGAESLRCRTRQMQWERRACLC